MISPDKLNMKQAELDDDEITQPGQMAGSMVTDLLCAVKAPVLHIFSNAWFFRSLEDLCCFRMQHMCI